MADSFFLTKCTFCGHLLQVVSEPQKVAFQLICKSIDEQLDWPHGSGHHIGEKKWAQLIMLAYERYHEREAEVLPAIDGDGWDVVYKRFGRLTKEEGAEVLAFADAWAADHDVVRSRSGRERRASAG